MILRPPSTLPHTHTLGGESSQSAVVRCNVIIARRLSLSFSSKVLFQNRLPACVFRTAAVRKSGQFGTIVVSVPIIVVQLFFSILYRTDKKQKTSVLCPGPITYRRCSTKSLSSGDFSRNSVYVCLVEAVIIAHWKKS